MPTKLDEIEDRLKTRSAQVINYMASKTGVEVDIIKRVQDVHSDVYGVHADKAPKGGVLVNKNVIITGDQFVALDAQSISTLQEGFIYDPDGDVEEGDLIEVKRNGVRIRQFHVMSNEAVGSTTTVLDRYKIVATGE